jgi:hypothetical protein
MPDENDFVNKVLEFDSTYVRGGLGIHPILKKTCVLGPSAA